MGAEGNLEQLSPCTKCGTQSGWYEKRVCKYLQFFDPNGIASDAGNMERVSGGQRRFCINCHKDITDQIGVPPEEISEEGEACDYCGGDGYHAVPRTRGVDCEPCNGTGKK